MNNLTPERPFTQIYHNYHFNFTHTVNYRDFLPFYGFIITSVKAVYNFIACNSSLLTRPKNNPSPITTNSTNRKA